MAAAIRRLGTTAGWGIVSLVVSLPMLGIVYGLWPDENVVVADIACLFAYQGLTESLSMSLFIALFAPLISLYLAFMVYSQYYGKRRWQSFERHLAPLLSLPHLAVALGLVFLFSSGGLWVLGDGLPRKSFATLMLAIIIKEVPFFLLILAAIGRQLPINTWLLQGKALGYQAQTGWWLLVLPSMLKQSRLALFAAMAYTLSVVDMSLVVGPNIPELLAVSLYRWQTSFNASDQSLAFWANVLMLSALVLCIALLYVHEKMLVAGLKRLAILGRQPAFRLVNRLFVAWLPVFALLSGLIVLVFALWSFGFNWQSAELSSALWQEEWLFLSQPLQNSLYIGLLTCVFGVGCALLALELQRQAGRYLADHYWLLAILLPQLSMVLGWQMLHLDIHGGYHFGWIALVHLPFTFAYAYLVLKGPFQSIDKHYELVGASFGYSYWQRWWKIRLRLLLAPILSALAIAFAVSIAQYIPTLMIGAGRVATITTEAVAIATGSDQNLIALYMLVQSLLPFLGFFIAAMLSRRIRGSVDVKHS